MKKDLMVLFTQTIKSFAKDVKPGESVLLDDGKLKVEVGHRFKNRGCL